MIIKRWRGNDVDVIPSLHQEHRHPDDWPYPQEWIVESLHWDTVNRTYWVHGHLGSGEPFHWGLYDDRRLDWRYDLTNASYQIGRHETESEARTQEDKERRLAVA